MIYLAMEGSKTADCYRSLTPGFENGTRPWRSMWNRWLPVLDRKEDHRGYGVKGLQRDRTACRDRQNPELLKYCLRQAQPRDPQVEDTPLNRIESARFSSECCPQPDQGGGVSRRDAMKRSPGTRRSTFLNATTSTAQKTSAMLLLKWGNSPTRLSP
jgi:hypothetical protein